MISKFKILLLCLVLVAPGIMAKSPNVDDKELKNTPPRIIRVCCAFGADIPMFGLPFVKIDQVISMDELGKHRYMGHKQEGMGLIYTRKGGFIDIAHLRDQADWTKYLYSLILANRENGEFVKKLGYEGGVKNLTIKADNKLDSLDCLLIAAKITYDLSLWHELSTWFGASAVPMMPERYSSFSVEDVYSNLLGIHIGIKALKSDLPFNEAMTKILYATLDSLGAVKTKEETYLALEAVKNVWWTNEKRLPSKKVILERDTEVYTYSRPWLVPDSLFGKQEPHVLLVPNSLTNGKLITDYYEFSIDLNYKFPVKEIFPERKTRIINQNDFAVLLRKVESDFRSEEPSAYTDLKPLEVKEPKERL